MKRLMLVIAVVAAFQLLAQRWLHAESKLDQVWVTQNLTSMPLAFTQNNGQWDERALFRADAGGATMWLTGDGMLYQFTRHIRGSGPDAIGLDSRLRGNDKDGKSEQLSVGQADSRPDTVSPLRNLHGLYDERDSLKMLVIKAAFVGANSHPEVVGLEEMEYKCNYFLGNDPAKWRTDVPNYRAVVLKGIYSGIDLKYYGNGDGKMEYDFIVAPGADVSQIKVQYEGAKSVSVDAAGRLIVSTDWTDVIEETPKVYQLIAGREVDIEGSYVPSGENAFGFRLGKDYDPAQPTVIDPVLAYSTYLGGNNYDEGFGIAVDSSGAAYVTGITYSSDFPMLNPYQGDQETIDAFVTKLSSDGTTLVYSTYLGGWSQDAGCGIAVDASGAAYVVGCTQSTNFPTLNPYQGTNQGGGWNDAFITKLSATGNSLLYSTYLGGNKDEIGSRIVVDAAGEAYVTGYTESADFPTLNPYQGTLRGDRNVFVTKLSSGGNELTYSTYLGGSKDDRGFGIAIDASGAVYVAGPTYSTDFPTVSPYQGTLRGGYNDAFVSKLSSDGDSLIYSTYLGGSDEDYGMGVAVDESGAAYVVGETHSSDFPTLNEYQGDQGYIDVFVGKLSSGGDSLVYSTYLGGVAADYAADIKVDGSGAAYATGWTHSEDFPTLNSYQGAGGYALDAFVTKLSSAGNSLIYSTYLGGSNDDQAGGIAVDKSGAAYVTGWTFSTDFPRFNAYQGTFQGGMGACDAFVTKFIVPPCCVAARGNANGDAQDKVNVTDVTYLLSYLFGVPSGPTPPCGEEANANGDPQEKVNVSDATYLLSYLFGIPSGPPPPACP